MKPWRVNQEVHKRIRVDPPSDLIENHQHEIIPLHVNDVVAYFTAEQHTLKFPAKSYAVAIIYALLIHDIYGDDVFESLSDPMLLAGDDMYFTPYTADPGTYDAAFNSLPWLTGTAVANLPFSQVKATVAYFKTEVLLTG